MELTRIIKETIREYLNESKSYPFNLNIKEQSDNGFTYKIFYYDFTIEDIEYECVIYPNAFKIRSKDFDVDFIW